MSVYMYAKYQIQKKIQKLHWNVYTIKMTVWLLTDFIFALKTFSKGWKEALKMKNVIYVSVWMWIAFKYN